MCAAYDRPSDRSPERSTTDRTAAPFPHTSQVRAQLRELRCHFGSALYRILYRRSGNLVILLHMLRKDSAVIPEADIALAEERWADFKRRMDTPKRRPPRAAGHDAP